MSEFNIGDRVRITAVGSVEKKLGVRVGMESVISAVVEDEVWIRPPICGLHWFPMENLEVVEDKSFVLIQDDDCHWYVCPADNEAEAHSYFEAVSRYWEDGPLATDAGTEPTHPEWLVRVGGSPSLVRFHSYTISE
jgi:hypothetical protein